MPDILAEIVDGQVNVPVLKLPDVGVPSNGVTNVGEFDNTTEPVPVEVVVPVPPLATAIVVPFQTPEVIVPTDCKLEPVTPEFNDEPVNVPAAAVIVIGAEPSKLTPLIARAVVKVAAEPEILCANVIPELATFLTNAVVAIDVELSFVATVVDVGVPVNEGEANVAFLLSKSCIAACIVLAEETIPPCGAVNVILFA